MIQRFQETWFHANDFGEAVSMSWKSGPPTSSPAELASVTSRCMSHLSRWGKPKGGSFGQRIRAATTNVQQVMGRLGSSDSRAELKRVEGHVDSLLVEE